MKIMEIIPSNSFDEGISNPALAKEGVKTYRFRVCYEDVDAAGIVYHARYFGIADRARTESIRRLGGTTSDLYKDFGLILVVREAEIKFRKPLYIDELVIVKTNIIITLGASCWLSQVFFRNEEIVTELKIQLVCLKKETYMPAPFPADWKRIFAAMM